MESYKILFDLAIILLSAKLCGLLARKLKAPQVVGEIIAGLIIGPCMLGIVEQTDFISYMGEIGVIILMFSAGLETNLKDLMKTGPVACFIAVMGVAVPLVLGTLLYMAFYGFAAVGTIAFYKAVFIGVIMTATSVSITVQVLKELGKIKTQIGTTIVSAAIIDDVIGIIVLTVVIGCTQSSTSISSVLISTVLFFILAIAVGFVIFWLFSKIDAKYPHTRKIPILGLVICFLFAYVAEEYFGLADITGAYVAGIVLCSLKDAEYIDTKLNINSYMIFGPMFFAGIGLKTTLNGLTPDILLFSICFVLVALVAKIIGCGLAAKICGRSNIDSLRAGIGMMTRGEVALIVAQKGLNAGLVDSIYFVSVILLIVVSSVVTPILLKLVFHEKHPCV